MCTTIRKLQVNGVTNVQINDNISNIQTEYAPIIEKLFTFYLAPSHSKPDLRQNLESKTSYKQAESC